MKLKIIRRAFLVLLLLASTWPLPPAHANPQNCAGDLCGRQYWSDEQRAAVEQRGFGGIWNALGERDREMFPNFYAAGNYLGGLLGDFLGNRYVQGGLEALEQASYGTPGGADDAIIRGLRNSPRILSHMDDAGGLVAIGALRGSGRSGGIGNFGDDAARVASELADTIPNMRAIGAGHSAVGAGRTISVFGRTPHQIVDIDGIKYIEFDARDAFLHSNYISPNGNKTFDTWVGVTAEGQVIVREGKHRTIAAAQGATITAEEGGIPGRPGWLRFVYSGEVQAQPSNVPVGYLVSHPSMIDSTEPVMTNDFGFGHFLDD